MSRWSGNIIWLWFFSATAWHCCKASCAFCVSLSKRNMLPFKQRGRLPPTACLPSFPTGETTRPSFNFRCLRLSFDLHLAWFSGFLLGKGHCQHAVVKLGADFVGVEHIRYGEAANE